MDAGESLSESRFVNLAALRTLNRFTEAEWTRWLRCIIEGTQPDPVLLLGRITPDRVLIWLYEDGLENTTNFVDAIAATYESSTPKRPQQLYYLLQAISVIKPPQSKALLLRHLREHRFDNTYFESHDLRTMALSVRSRYGFEETFHRFIETSLISVRDFGYRLTCFRALGDYMPAEALAQLDLLLPYLGDPQSKKIVGILLRGFVWTWSCQPLFDWYTSESRARLTAAEPTWMTNLDQVLRTWVVPWRPSRFVDDPHGVLLSAILFAGHRPFVAEEILMIANLARHRLTPSPLSVITTLRHLWDCTQAVLGRWCALDPLPAPWTNCLPWLGPPQQATVTTYWRNDVLHAESSRELFCQEVQVHAELEPGAEITASVLARGARALPTAFSHTESGLSIEDEVDRAFHKFIQDRDLGQLSEASLEP